MIARLRAWAVGFACALVFSSCASARSAQIPPNDKETERLRVSFAEVEAGRGSATIALIEVQPSAIRAVIGDELADIIRRRQPGLLVAATPYYYDSRGRRLPSGLVARAGEVLAGQQNHLWALAFADGKFVLVDQATITTWHDPSVRDSDFLVGAFEPLVLDGHVWPAEVPGAERAARVALAWNTSGRSCEGMPAIGEGPANSAPTFTVLAAPADLTIRGKGLTLHELARFAAEARFDCAINLDGGRAGRVWPSTAPGEGVRVRMLPRIWPRAPVGPVLLFFVL